MPITPQDDPEGEPIGTLQGELEDMQGRFNLNNLARVTTDGKQDPQPLEQFQRLLRSVASTPNGRNGGDWIDADDLPGSRTAPKTRSIPRRPRPTAPALAHDLAEELMNLPGFGADNYRKIAPT